MKILIFVLFILCFVFISGFSQSSYQLKEAFTASGTILNAGNSNYALSGSAGQVIIDTSENNLYSVYSGFWYQYPLITDIGNDNDELLPKVFDLQQNYPNPFNPVTNIDYALPNTSNVTIEIYNILGQKVLNIVDQKQAVGYYSVKWHGLNSSNESVANGMYIYRMVAKSNDGKVFVKSKKMLFLK